MLMYKLHPPGYESRKNCLTFTLYRIIIHSSNNWGIITSSSATLCAVILLGLNADQLPAQLLAKNYQSCNYLAAPWRQR